MKNNFKREVDAVYNLCNFYQNNVIGEEESLPDAPLSGLKTEMENSPNEQTSETKKATVAPAGIKTSMASTEPCGVILESTKRKREIQNEPSFRIEHGQQTHEDDYPFIAYVAARCTMEGKLGKLQHCTGTIIQRRWILTAAHCTFKNATELAKTYKCSDFPGIETTIDRVEGSHKWMYKLPAMNMFVSVGSKYDPENPNWLSVKSVIRHDAYKSDSDAHDIALLELENPLDFGPKINRICLARAFEPVAGDNAMIMGFGITKGPVENANKINEDKNHLREDTIRFKTVGCPAGFFCQNHPLRKTTHGDSGGPVVRTKANSGSWYEIALVRGHSDQNVALPNLNLFTRIGPHCDWIAKNTRSECQCGSM